MPFANTNFLMASAIDSAGILFDCRITTDECSKWLMIDRTFFGSMRVPREWDEATDARVMDFARRSQAEVSATGAEYDIELLTQARQKVQKRRILPWRSLHLAHAGPMARGRHRSRGARLWRRGVVCSLRNAIT